MQLEYSGQGHAGRDADKAAGPDPAELQYDGTEEEMCGLVLERLFQALWRDSF